MKRKEEVSIIVEALNQNGLLDSKKMNDARGVIKSALKEIRCRKYTERYRRGSEGSEGE